MKLRKSDDYIFGMVTEKSWYD